MLLSTRGKLSRAESEGLFRACETVGGGKFIHKMKMRSARVNFALSKNLSTIYDVSSQPIYVIVNKSLPMRLSSRMWRGDDYC